MLELQWSLVGSPSGGFQHLTFKHTTHILYPCAQSIVILNAEDLALVCVLAFSDVFPSATHTDEIVSCLSVDDGMKLIVASMKARIAAWSLSGIQQDTWRVHSSLILPEDYSVTTLDCKSGLLAVGCQAGLAVYTLTLENDLPTWSQKWMVTVTSPSLARFAPSLRFIATISHNGKEVQMYPTTLGRRTQTIPHPRPITAICWRHSQASSRDDLILYTITSDSTLRVFLPVLDSPNHLQLHASLDIYSALPFPLTSDLARSKSSVFWLDRQVVGDALKRVLKDHPELHDAQSRRLKEINDEGWDLFLRVLADGSIIISAIANIDRKPPTLLSQFTLHQSLPSALPCVPDHLYLLPKPDSASITLVASNPLMSLELDLLKFFGGQSSGLQLRATCVDRVPEEETSIVRFVRTPEGKGVGVLRTHGGESWSVVDHGKRCNRAMRWSEADLVVVLAQGRSFATYSALDGILTLHSKPPCTLPLPEVTSLFLLPWDDCESIVAVAVDFTIFHILVQDHPVPSLSVCSQDRLPLTTAPKAILTVDPMAWSGRTVWMEHDVLLSVSEEGELAFWHPEENARSHWKCTGKVKTGRRGFTKANCSSSKKSALVTPHADGEELTVWDSKESEFSSGLEYCFVYNSAEKINDLDYTSTPDGQSILAVGFTTRVELLSQQRKTYFDDDSNWAVVCRIEIGSFTPYSISDSIWLTDGSLLVGAGHQMFLFGQSLKDPNTETLFEHVARHNGPLPDYHPQILLQCLLWGKVELVKDIIIRLARALQEAQTNNQLAWVSVPTNSFLKRDHLASLSPTQKKRHTFLFNALDIEDEPEEEVFGRAVVLKTLEYLESKPLPHFTPNENEHLQVLIQTTLEIDEQRRALDENGLRYLISMRSFYILNRRASTPGSRASSGVIPRKTGWRERLRYRDMIWAFFSESQDILVDASISACDGKFCWSDARALGVAIWLNSVESLKTNLETIARNEYMAGENRDPTTCTLFYFALGKAKLVHGLWRQAAWHKEQAIMLKFLSNDFSEARWRTAALKNAYALLSKQRFEYAAAFFMLSGCLRDAVAVCVKHLSDFQLAIALARVVEQSNEGPVFTDLLQNTVLPTAFKNGNRWLACWAFWMMRRRDLAVRILLTPLQDIASALDIRLCDVGDSSYDDPSLALLFSQLRSKTLQAAQGTSEISGRAEFNFVLQMARVFCRMGCHVLALDLVRSWSFDRPSTHIRWEAEKPTVELPSPLSPTPRRRTFGLELALRRRSSIVIDVDIPTEPPTRKGSPEQNSGSPQITIPISRDTINEEGDLFARKAGIGSLLKSAKQDVRLPEFNMDAFL